MKGLLTLFVVLLPVYVVADTVTVTGIQPLMIQEQLHTSFLADFNGVPIYDNTDHPPLPGASTDFSLFFSIPENAIITDATLTLSRWSHASIFVTSYSTPWGPDPEMGCAELPCPFEPGHAFGDVSTDSREFYASLGDASHTVILNEGNDIHLNAVASQGSAMDQGTAQDSFVFDLKALGWLDALNGSHLLQITGANHMDAVLGSASSGYGWGVGADTQVGMLAIRYDEITATLKVKYFVPVPEPGTLSLVLLGAVAGVRTMRRRWA